MSARSASRGRLSAVAKEQLPYTYPGDKPFTFTDLSKSYTTVPEFKPRQKKIPFLVLWWNLMGLELSTIMLQTSELVILHLWFWTSVGYTIYQALWLTGVLTQEGV